MLKLKELILKSGVRASDDISRERAIGLSNLTALSAAFNTFLLAFVVLYFGHVDLFQKAALVGILYVVGFLFVAFGKADLGRILVLVFGNASVFYFSCITRGESMVQCFFYSLSISPYMYFAWEERRYYLLSIVSIGLLLIGEANQWNFFDYYHHSADIRTIRIISILATLQQIVTGFYYYLKLSVKFEAESKLTLKNLESEHRNQLQVQKMSSLGEMSAGVSHEINNPLMVIMGKTHTLKRELSKNSNIESKSMNNLFEIDAMVEKISRIIKALRYFSRNSENDPKEAVALKTILDSTLDLCRERFLTAGINLNLDTDESLRIFCRPTEISQVFLNLLNNAFEASSQVTDPVVTITCRRSDKRIEILLSNNGPRITAEVADKIMQPFFTTKEVGKGTGLGLSISKGLVESHGGTLTYLPEMGQTTFQILLPLFQD